VRDYLFVEDVAGALWHLARNRIAGVYNICSGNPVTVRGLLELVAGLLGGEGRVRFGALPDRDWEPKFICGDNTRLLNTGWRAETSLPEGLKRTIAWWSCQADS
jgi:nucleoside-diphosphate-sugar epimerase